MDTIWMWVGFNLFVLAMLALDLGVFHRKAHAVGLREALQLERGLDRARAGLQRRGLAVPRAAGRARVPHRLPDREVALASTTSSSSS